MVRITRHIKALKLLAAGACAMMAAMWATPSQADPEKITILTPAALRFGTFAVPTTGFREVTASGTITSSGIVSLDDSGVGPARFVIEYDRGNNSRRRLDLTIEVVLSSPAVFTQGGLSARLSRYQTDLPGYGLVQAGQVIRMEIPNCTTRVCSRSFSLGGRLDVDRSFGGGLVEIPVPIDAAVVSVN
ncbi:DUF4402 domain-containing protein [Erythrobacter mangrovi]|uniref:DUF4402 domain-containing protein n=1 Tax=Erythrobacter mangrovi TaxID=2739433 RepID=A0A7D4C2X4_9SPHN|nr:DUF4402 domain-containing protein [Erythrobacter mangrovi]QKG70605.1 DUF4402 domain-containing protein [Erythrobacter mangrovi]